MSLADLVLVIPTVKMPRRALTRTEIQMRWVAKNRRKFNAYRQQWYRERKAA